MPPNSRWSEKHNSTRNNFEKLTMGRQKTNNKETDTHDLSFGQICQRYIHLNSFPQKKEEQVELDIFATCNPLNRQRIKKALKGPSNGFPGWAPAPDPPGLNPLGLPLPRTPLARGFPGGAPAPPALPGLNPVGLPLPRTPAADVTRNPLCSFGLAVESSRAATCCKHRTRRFASWRS